MVQVTDVVDVVGTAPGGRARRNGVARNGRADMRPNRHDDGGEPFVAGLVEIVREVSQCRNLIYQLTLRDLRIRYKQAVMGFAWAVLIPVLVVLASLMVRLLMAEVAGVSLALADIGGIAVKGLAWSFFVGTIGLATTSLVSSAGLLTKIYFPREVIPLATTIAQTVDSLLGAVVLAIVLPFLGMQFTPQLLWVPVLVGCLFGFTLAAALLLSCANLFFRDVKYIVQVMLTFGIFATPVFFDVSMFGPGIAPVLMLNPLAPMLEGLRLAVIDGHNLLQPLVEVNRNGERVLAWTPWYLLIQLLWAGVGLVLSLHFFRRASAKFAEYV